MENLPLPTPFASEALVEIHYFGVNYAGMVAAHILVPTCGVSF